MAHPQPFRVPSGRPSVGQTAKELGVSPSEFVRITEMVNAVLSGAKGGSAVERTTARPSTPRRAAKKSRARTKRQGRGQLSAKRN